MLIDIDFAQLSNPCIGEIAKQTSSADVLDKIAEYAIGEGLYADGMGPFPDESYFYMDEVLMNQSLSDDTLSKLIKYDKSRDLHMCIIGERKLNDNQIDLMINHITDLSIIHYLIEKQTPMLTTKQYDTIARRIMSGDICTKDCYNFFKDFEAKCVDKEIYEISRHCTEQIARDLLGWWSVIVSDVKTMLDE